MLVFMGRIRRVISARHCSFLLLYSILFIFSFEDYKVFVEAFHSQLDDYGDTAWQGSLQNKLSWAWTTIQHKHAANGRKYGFQKTTHDHKLVIPLVD